MSRLSPNARLSTAILLASASILAIPTLAAPLTYTTPNTGPGPITTTLGNYTFINKGLQGVGRIDASLRDDIGDTFGSVSSMTISNWSRNTRSGAYSGTFNTLPDRGRNDPANGIFYDYAGRIQTVSFSFTPYTGNAPLGGATLVDKKLAQNQIVATYEASTPFTYANPNAAAGPAFLTTTGLNPNQASSLFGKPIPFAAFQTISGVNVAVNKLSLDAEGLVLLPDGSGYVSDEYGAYTYRFNANKEITGILGLPDAMLPNRPANTPNFDSITTPTNGRRQNQGLEGLSISPDGTKLFALAQSATVQDTNGAQQQTRNNTRLLVYDISANHTPATPSAEYVLQLPTLNVDGDNGPLNRTAAQSEIVVVDHDKILVLARDSAGFGGALTTPTIVKSVFLYDISGATNIIGNAAMNSSGGRIATAGVLDPTITPATGAEVLNMTNLAELTKFNFNLNNNSGLPMDELSFSEKWEGMSLVPALDPANPFDYFLFIANDNDFNTKNGFMKLADGTFENYVGDVNNDTTFLAYRVTIVPEPVALAMLPLASLALRRRPA